MSDCIKTGHGYAKKVILLQKKSYIMAITGQLYLHCLPFVNAHCPTVAVASYITKSNIFLPLEVIASNLIWSNLSLFIEATTFNRQLFYIQLGTRQCLALVGCGAGLRGGGPPAPVSTQPPLGTDQL